MAHENILIVEDLKKHFPLKGGLRARAVQTVKAVDGVSLVIKRGETFGLVGESGCGKTTLGRCILRLEEPTAGKILFENRNILAYDRSHLRRLRRDMQIIFQDPYSSLNPRQTVGQLISEVFAIHGIGSKSERLERAKQLMETVGLLPEHVDRFPHEFSGGQRQRICVARALSLNPKLLIADEPVSALDVSIQAQILNLLIQLQQQFNLTYLFISHDLSVVKHISDQVAVMYLGRIVEQAASGPLFGQPLHPYTQALLSSVPAVSAPKKKERYLLGGDVPSPINPPAGCTFHPRCRYRQEICIQNPPRMREIEANHWVACYFPQSRK